MSVDTTHSEPQTVKFRGVEDVVRDLLAGVPTPSAEDVAAAR